MKEKLSTPSLVWIIVGGMVGSGLMTITGAAAAETGYSVWLAFIIATILGFLASWPIVLAAGTTVLDGGLFSLNASFGHPIAGGLYIIGLLPQIMGQASVALGIGMYLQTILPSTPVRIVAVLCILLFYYMNIRGIDAIVGIQKYMVYILFAGLALFTIFGLLHLNTEALNPVGKHFFTNGFLGFAVAVNLLSFSTQSYWCVLPFSKFAKNPQKIVPRAMLIAFPIIALIYGLVTLAAVGGVNLETFSGNTLGDVASILFPKWLFYIFVICAPLMALATTLNSNLASYALMIKPAADDGWLPKILTRTNKNNMPYASQTLVMLIIVIPVIFNWDVSFITANVMLFVNLTALIQYFAMWLMPKHYPELWKNSRFYMTNIKFHILMLLAFAVRLILLIASLVSLSFTSLCINITIAIILTAYCIIQYKRGVIALSNPD